MTKFYLDTTPSIQKYIVKPYKLYISRHYFPDSNTEVVSYCVSLKEPRKEKDFHTESGIVLGFINTLFDYVYKRVEVNFLRSFKGKCGIGTLLLLLVLKEADEKGMITVILDDDSDNYRLENNIYKKLGFVYCGEYCPEMEGVIKEIIGKWSEMVDKYKWETK